MNIISKMSKKTTLDFISSFRSLEQNNPSALNIRRNENEQE
jgi:hypothetical protein